MASLQSTRSAWTSCSRCVSASRSSALNLGSLAASLPSTSYQPSSSSFHTSAPASESRKKRTARLKRKNNLDQRMLKVRMLESSKPDPVLGHQLDEAGQKVWEGSELARLILDKEEVWGVKEDRRGNLVSTKAKPKTLESAYDRAERLEAEAFGGPRRLNFGLDASDRQLLFQSLPTIMVKDRILDSANLGVIMKGTPNPADVGAFEDEYTRVIQEEQSASTILSRVLDLRNASGKGIQVENIRRIVNHFGQREKMEQLGKGVDTGSAEVQAAVLTYRIRNLASHLQAARHDNSNRRAMTLLVQQRAKILKYLKRQSPARYHAILPRIGIEARAVEGEIVVPGKPKIATA
ncbi:uncharacterized protein PFL1_03815 [Pseudozyma flocculosa PF-1]|uniref:Related to MRPS28 - mitochondrial ribosomal protein, small subunit n=2 Tax=Pseudozyma flocculosa TaxID=84751 RepID=A0A5C3EVY8_9BASI|nr:uncharacterized protein PFL1_03815 [Pseudozyma flocculosa PF-1]EPQ28512.1 hypothetical protein PFL1_03815 [Pseudozyma flocculosa PF-1]SPO36434.1 related to MRPS28 - mitochondrial ribosomal protein, small subunit [Pseudozyma flocculosa]